MSLPMETDQFPMGQSLGQYYVTVGYHLLNHTGTMGHPVEDYDLSQIAYPGEAMKYVPLWEAILKIGFCVLIMLVAILGNLAVIVTVWKKKRLRSTTNYYMVNLAVSDLLVTVSCTWVQVVHNLMEGWQLGAFFCKFNSFSQVLSLVSSILTLTLISCDRFFGIMFAMRAHLVERRAYVFIILVWILSIGVSAPILFFRHQQSRVWLDHVEVWCADNWPLSADGSNAGIYRRTYYTLISIVLFFMPIAIMSVAYILIIYKLWSWMPPGEVIDCDISTQVRVKRKVILMLMTILSVFAVCWLPLQISILYAEHRQDMSKLPYWYEDFNYFATFLAYSNSAINPIVYTCFNENYRKAFIEVFTCNKRGRTNVNGHHLSYSYYNSVEMRTQDRQTEVTSTQIFHLSEMPKKTEVLAAL